MGPDEWPTKAVGLHKKGGECKCQTKPDLVRQIKRYAGTSAAGVALHDSDCSEGAGQHGCAGQTAVRGPCLLQM